MADASVYTENSKSDICLNTPSATHSGIREVNGKSMEQGTQHNNRDNNLG